MDKLPTTIKHVSLQQNKDQNLSPFQKKKKTMVIKIEAAWHGHNIQQLRDHDRH